MEAYGSFKIDHNKLNPGIYVSRVDKVGIDNGAVVTVDIRVRKPYKDRTLSKMEMHSIEHLIATALEDLCTAKIKKVYFGPFGCATGFYALFYVPQSLMNNDSNLVDKLILNILYEAFSRPFYEIPFNSRTECGDCRTLAKDPEDICKVRAICSDVAGLINAARAKGEFDDYPS